MTPAPQTPPIPPELFEAMRRDQDEADKWAVADLLVKLVPEGSSLFDQIADEAAQRGLSTYTPNTLRLYRDTARRWPEDKRVKGMSFGQHREVMTLETVDAGVKMLEDLSKVAGGPEKVTIKQIRDAVAAKRGKNTPAAPTPPAPKQTWPVLDDLRQGGPELIKALTSSTPLQTLDEVHAGLTAVQRHVTALRTTAQRKAAAAQKAAAAAKSSSTTTATVPEPGKTRIRKAQGNLRGK